MITLEKRLEQMVSETVLWMGFRLWGIQFYPQQALLRIYIDKDGGITIDDCAAVSRQLSAVLDVEDLINQAYVLEVSSPGLDRPLMKPEHWQQSIGEKVRVSLLTPQAGQVNFKGRLRTVEQACAVLDTDGGQTHRLPLSSVKRARIIPAE